MLTVGRLVRIVKTIGDKVISKSTFYNTFNYLGYEREVGDWPVVGCRNAAERRSGKYFRAGTTLGKLNIVYHRRNADTAAFRQIRSFGLHLSLGILAWNNHL